MDHECKHEGDFGTILAEIQHLKKSQKDLKEVAYKIFDRLEGKNGLCSKVAVLESKFNGMPSPKSVIIQASIWGGMTGALAVLGYIFLK